MKTRTDIFDIFMQDENYKYIMKRLLDSYDRLLRVAMTLLMGLMRLRRPVL